MMKIQLDWMWHLCLVTAATGVTATASAQRLGDFNGDGYADIAVGVPFEDVSGKIDAGAINVLYGTFGGIRDVKNQFWHQDKFGILEDCNPNDQFGFAIAVGDFNGDGFTDMAVGVPFETDEGFLGGAVNVIYGLNQSTGLWAGRNQLWRREGTSGPALASDFYGRALAVGDFNNDGFDDLAIGVPGAKIGNHSSAGGVEVIYGSADGLKEAGKQWWHQDVPQFKGVARPNDRFGWALAAGDFNNDGFDDLAIGVPGDNIVGVKGAGAINVIRGSAAGLTNTQDTMIHRAGGPFIALEGTPPQFENFGSVLAVGDFNNDGFDDLAIGVPEHTFIIDESAFANAGAVHVVYGSASGLTATGAQFWHQDSPGIPDVVETRDQFGASLAVGDFNNDGFDDLAIGAPGEGRYGLDGIGVVHVIYGTSNGLFRHFNQVWHQLVEGMKNRPGAGDEFGRALAAGDINGDGFDDLVVGIPGENINGQPFAGAIAIIYGSANRLTAANNQFWYQGWRTTIDIPEAGDQFGRSLGVGR